MGGVRRGWGGGVKEMGGGRRDRKRNARSEEEGRGGGMRVRRTGCGEWGCEIGEGEEWQGIKRKVENIKKGIEKALMSSSKFALTYIERE